MRRTFIPPSFDFDREIEKKKIEIARRKEEKLTIFLREMRELEEKERLRTQRREQEEREKFEQELREEEEQLRKEKEEKERKEFEERVRQEKEFKRKQKEIERKEIMLREVEIQHPTTPCKDLKGVIAPFNSSLFVINTFVLVLPKIASPPSSYILNTSKEFPKIFFDLELPFRYQLSQSDKQYFCEVGYVPNPSKIKRPSSYIPYKYLLLPSWKVTEKLFDDYCIHIFDPRGIHL